MATTGQLDLRIWRNDDVYEFPLRIVGPNLSGISMRAQFRLAPDTPGPPQIGLGNVGNGNAEGIRLAGVTQVDGTWVNDVRIRINKSTRQTLPYSGEVGDAAALAWAFQIDGRTRLAGSAYILAHAIDSDGAPTSRPVAYGRSASNVLPSGGATLTIADDDVAQIVLDGADFADAAAQAAQASAAEAAASVNTATLAASTVLASTRYFTTRAAGEAGSSTGQFFSAPSSGTIIYYEKTAGGSVEVGRALTQAVLPVLLVDTFATARAAYNALPPGGGTLLFGAKRYDSLTPTPADRLTKPNVRLSGSGRPKPDADLSRLADGTGTIINGPLYFWGDNFEITDLGVDSGPDICSAYYGGSPQDGLMSFKLDQIAWNEVTSPNSKGLTVRNVGTLCQSPGAPVHAMLLEAYDHADVSNVEVTHGLHGFVGKLRFSNVRGVRAYGQAGGGSGEGEGFLLKGNAYAPLAQVNATGIVVEGGSYPNDNGIGIQVLAEGVAGAGGVSISDFKVYSKAKGVDLSGMNLADVTMTGGLVETCITGVSYGAGIKRCHVDTLINNSTLPVSVASTGGDLSNSFDGKITNASGDTGIAVGTGKLTIGDPYFENIASGDRICVRVSSTGRVRFGNLRPKSGTFLQATNATPPLANGWSAVSGNGTPGNSPAPWAIVPSAGGFTMSGVLTPGTSDIFATLPEWLRPSVDFYFSVRVISGATEETRRGLIRTDGGMRIIAPPTEAGSIVFLDGVRMPDTFLPI